MKTEVQHVEKQKVVTTTVRVPVITVRMNIAEARLIRAMVGGINGLGCGNPRTVRGAATGIWEALDNALCRLGHVGNGSLVNGWVGGNNLSACQTTAKDVEVFTPEEIELV